jgi:hypothetical protein
MNLQVGETPQWGLAGKQVNIGEKSLCHLGSEEFIWYSL